MEDAVNWREYVKRARFVAVCGLGLVCLAALWASWKARAPQTGGLSVSFAGLTNAGSGVTAQFSVTNAGARRVRFGIGEVQVRQTNGWPNWMRVAGGSNWVPVAAYSQVLIRIAAPAAPQGSSWRVPLVYEQDPSLVRDVLDRVKGIVNWFCGNRSYRIIRPRAFAHSPELEAGSNQPLRPIEPGHPVDRTNASGPAGPGR